MLTSTTPIGVPSDTVDPDSRHDALKELVNKLAWAIGSTYHRSYANRRCEPRMLAITLAADILTDQGFPAHLAGK